MNLIKINCLNGKLLVNKNVKFLKRINNNLTETMGKVVIPIIIDSNELNAEFHLVRKNFLTQKYGILEHTIVYDSKAIIEVSNNIVTI